MPPGRPVLTCGMKQPKLALYGNLAIPRVWCPECQSHALVVGGKIACCGTIVPTITDGVERMSEPVQRRNLPSKKVRDEILQEQDYRCLYCESRFGATHKRGGTVVVLRIHWDHRVPYSYDQDNRDKNFAAACHVCNSIKSDLQFRDLAEAMVVLAGKRRDKGYDF